MAITQQQEKNSIALLFAYLDKMAIAQTIDAYFHTHRNWNGLSYGQLSVLFIAYVLHTRSHSLSNVEAWVVEHHSLLERTTGWRIGFKDATDDRLGRVVEVLGQNQAQLDAFQRKLADHVVVAYQLLDDDAIDTLIGEEIFEETRPSRKKKKYASLGRTKGNRFDLLQLEQALGTLNPAGIPILTEVLAENQTDVSHYLASWRGMRDKIGHGNFVFVAGIRAATLQTRMKIDEERGIYLFPLPVTDPMYQDLQSYVLNDKLSLKDIKTIQKDARGARQEVVVGQGFSVRKTHSIETITGVPHKFKEQLFIVRNTMQAKRLQDNLERRLQQAELKLAQIKQKTKDTPTSFIEKAKKILTHYGVETYINLDVEINYSTKKCYASKGRPKPDTPYREVQIPHFELKFSRSKAALSKALVGMEWRIYATNACPSEMGLLQSFRYYRDQWLCEQTSQRFKQGTIPVLPLLRIDARIKGLTSLLIIALQIMKLSDFKA